ncbi:uncharacterized protein TA15710 [Theileria annulata]|uniref:Uncharacterized protein n=1 Tax=Theileria annulata TaxID=5874 RepID=Q4UFM8_THEAN|nr:uncharacterized protein TA15710 [Theileria annulata]CAI74088.1 hypothetical protein TA15710 [Theileria annulata]|eukprot:XP_951820.1 hypothetical protein TA15710 [Theileria annulata]
MNLVTSGIILYSFYICVCMDPDGSEPEKSDSGIRLYGDGDPVFTTTLKLTPEEANILKDLLVSYQECVSKSGSKPSDDPKPDLGIIRRDGDGNPLFLQTHEVTQEEAEILSWLLKNHDPKQDPSAPPEERPPPYSPGPYLTPGPSAPPYPIETPGGYGGYMSQGPYGQPSGAGYGAPGYGPYFPGGYGQQTPGTYPYPYPQQGPYGAEGATGGYGGGATGGAGGYGTSWGQVPSAPEADPSGPSGVSTPGAGGLRLVHLDAKVENECGLYEVLEYNLPGKGGKHRRYKPNCGFGIRMVTYAGVVVWKMDGQHHATEVTLIGVGTGNKKIDVKLSNGTRVRFKRGGKDKQWKRDIEKQ